MEGAISGCAEGLINQVHYDDAAAAVVAALLRGPRGATLLVADDQPLSRRAICLEARRAPEFSKQSMPNFSDGGGRGKVVDCSHTRAVLNWQPRYRTFGDFISVQLNEGTGPAE